MAKVKEQSPGDNLTQELAEAQASIDTMFDELPQCIFELRNYLTQLEAAWEAMNTVLTTEYQGDTGSGLVGVLAYTFAEGPTSGTYNYNGNSFSNYSDPADTSGGFKGNIWAMHKSYSQLMIDDTKALINRLPPQSEVQAGCDARDEDMLERLVTILHGDNNSYLYWNNGVPSNALDSGGNNWGWAAWAGANERLVRASLARWYLPWPISGEIHSERQDDNGGQAGFASEYELDRHDATKFSSAYHNYDETWHPAYWAQGLLSPQLGREAACTHKTRDLMEQAHKRYKHYKGQHATDGTVTDEDSWEGFMGWRYADFKARFFDNDSVQGGMIFDDDGEDFGVPYGRIRARPNTGGGSYTHTLSTSFTDAGQQAGRGKITVNVGRPGSPAAAPEQHPSTNLTRGMVKWWRQEALDELMGLHWLLSQDSAGAGHTDPSTYEANGAVFSGETSYSRGSNISSAIGKSSLSTSARGCMDGAGLSPARPTIMNIFAHGSFFAPDTFQWWLAADSYHYSGWLFYDYEYLGGLQVLKRAKMEYSNSSQGRARYEYWSTPGNPGYNKQGLRFDGHLGGCYAAWSMADGASADTSRWDCWRFSLTSCRQGSTNDDICKLMNIPSVDSGYITRAIFDSERDRKSTGNNANNALTKGAMYGTGSPSASGGANDSDQCPLGWLMEGYGEWKSAVWTFKEKLECAVQLILEAHLKVNDLEELAEAVADPASPAHPIEKRTARQILDEIGDASLADLATLAGSFTKRLVFKEQCFLLAKIFDLAEYKTGVDVNADDASTAAGVGTDHEGNEYTAFAGGLDYIPGYKAAPYLNDIAAKMNVSPYGTDGLRNASLLMDGDPYGFINRLTQDPGQWNLMSAKGHEISSLQPMIKLYIVKFNNNTNREEEVPITFSSHMSPEEVNRAYENNLRGHGGVGIKNFEFTYDGSNPFAAKKSIKAKLTIFAQSMSDLLTRHTSDSFVPDVTTGAPQHRQHAWRYVDLALKTGGASELGTMHTIERCVAEDPASTREVNENLSRLNFRLKAVVGWADPTNIENVSNSIKDAIYNSYVTLNLTPTVHDFDLDEQGRVLFNINYLAYTDDFFDQRPYNIFAAPNVTKKQLRREFTYKVYRRNCLGDAIEGLKESDAELILNEKKESVSNLIRSLLAKDKIYYINMSMDEIRNFMSQGPFYEINSGNGLVPLTSEDRDAAMDDNLDNLVTSYMRRNTAEAELEIRAALNTARPDRGDISFFYLSDLVDIILEDIGNLLPNVTTWLTAHAGNSLASGYLQSLPSADALATSEMQARGRIPDWKAQAAALYDEEVEDIEAELERCRAEQESADYQVANGMTEVDIQAGLQACEDVAGAAIYDADMRDDMTREPQEVGGHGEVVTTTNSRGEVTHTGAESGGYADTFYEEVIGDTADEIYEENRQRAYDTATAAATAHATADEASWADEYDECDLLLKRMEYSRLETEFKKLRILLGPMEIVDYRNDITTRNISIGDIPISVKYFIEWLTEKLSSKEETKYPLGSFMNDLLNNLVRNFLNDDTCFQTNIKQRTRITQATITAYKDPSPESNPQELDQVTASIKRFFPDPRNPGRVDLQTFLRHDGPLNISGPRGQPGGNGGFENEINYLAFVAGRTQPREKMTGNPAIDVPAGVFHYSLGKDSGLVKNIKLSKTQTPGLTEVRFEQEGYDGLAQLRVVYDVDIESYANVKVFPGTYLFVNPQSFAPGSSLDPGSVNNLTRYGIGGYYMVIHSTHKFGAGVATSKIHAKWVNQVDALGERDDQEGNSDGGSSDGPHCR